MGSGDLDRFRNLTFEDFKRMAMDPKLLPHEKIGFPGFFRQGYDLHILNDITTKLVALNQEGSTIIDIGCGCGELTQLLADRTARLSQALILVDSEEVLSQIKDASHITKVPGEFPANAAAIANIHADAILCYSVFHYIFGFTDIYRFIDEVLELLKPGGEFLLGDIPNVSKRNRFLQTPAGELFHKSLMSTSEKPSVKNMSLEIGKIDDGVLLGLLSRYRNFGFESYLFPQPDILPLSNSRDDIVIRKPK